MTIITCNTIIYIICTSSDDKVPIAELKWVQQCPKADVIRDLEKKSVSGDNCMLREAFVEARHRVQQT